LQGQGAVTEGERRIVQRLSGNVSNSPEFLRARMALLKERSQFDMDIAKNWNAWEKKNPGKSFLQFERSEEYADLERNYEKRLGELEGRLPALPSSERPARTTPAGQNTGLDAARARARKALEQGKN